MLRRSQLYVPGNNEKMVVKATTLAADSVVLDLEDAVPEEQKGEAREVVSRLSRELDWGKRELCARVNAVGSRHFAADRAAVGRCKRLDTLLVPKSEGDLSSLHSRTGKGIIPIIETAKGLLDVRKVAASDGTVAITYGPADYAASVGGAIPAYVDNAVVKTIIVAAAATEGVDAIDGVFFDLDDSEGFRRQAMASRALGYVGKQVVHPSQIAVANEVFSPTREELEWARKVVEGLGSAGRRGAVRLEGRLVDSVHLRLAKSLIERARGGNP